MKNTYSIFFFLLLFSLPTFAGKYKVVLEKPLAFEHPIDQSDRFYNYNNKKEVERIKKSVWEVYSDRVGNVSESGKPLKFKKSYYVLDETDTKILLASAILSGNKITELIENHGWIEKSQMLLWGNVLIDENTKIQRKGFLLNTKESLERIIVNPSDKSKVKIYDRPNLLEAKELEKNRIYEFYFIIKKEKIAPAHKKKLTSKDYMYLLCKNIRLGGLTISDELVGWVSGDRIDEWNTRIALEPNFSEDAVKERQANLEKNQVIAFTSSDLAKDYAFTYRKKNDDVLWNNDPLTKSSDKLAQSNNFRFKGGVIRFPMLKKNNENNFFKTAIVGEITLTSFSEVMGYYDIIEYSKITNEIARLNNARKNFNIVYIINETKNSKKISNLIKEHAGSIQGILSKDVSVKFGAVNFNSANTTNFQKIELTANLQKFNNFVDDINLNNYSKGELKNALETAIMSSGFKLDETNFIVYVEDELAGDIEKNALNQNTEIIYSSSDLNLHFLCLSQSNGPTSNLGDNFNTLMLRSAKANFESYKNIGNLSGLDFREPRINQEKTSFNLEHGSTFSRFIKVKKNADLKDELNKATKNLYAFTTQISDKSNKIFDDGVEAYEKGTAGQFGPALAQIITKNLKIVDEQQIKKLLLEKYQLYLRAFVPIKMANKKHDLFSYVLFMPEEDLESLAIQLRQLSISVDETPDKKRDALVSVWRELVKQYTGESEEDIKKMDLETIQLKMQGVKNEGLKFETDKPLAKMNLQDLMNRRKISDSQINDYINKLSGKFKTVESILKQGKAYEFSYTSNGFTYFWIPSNLLP